MKAIVTGSGGLIGAACVEHLCSNGWDVIGLDNDMRARFFGTEASTRPTVEALKARFSNYRHEFVDVRDRETIRNLFSNVRPSFIIHAAAQPSHDLAASVPYDDFDVNAVGTLNLLVATRDYCRDSPFCFMSTNKVYGDRPNSLALVELEKRFDYANDVEGIDEAMSVDQCLHSLFGASKLAADTLCQEFGRYFGMPIGVFRGGCLTGPGHAAVELHGYLAYIVRCAVIGKRYTVFGYGGKQVRDQIHANDVACLFAEFYRSPRAGEVYNLGGGRANSISVRETIDLLDSMGFKLDYDYSKQNRMGDHICYISDLSKLRDHFPSWKLNYDLPRIVSEIVERNRLSP